MPCTKAKPTFLLFQRALGNLQKNESSKTGQDGSIEDFNILSITKNSFDLIIHESLLLLRDHPSLRGAQWELLCRGGGRAANFPTTDTIFSKELMLFS